MGFFSSAGVVMEQPGSGSIALRELGHWAVTWIFRAVRYISTTLLGNGFASNTFFLSFPPSFLSRPKFFSGSEINLMSRPYSFPTVVGCLAHKFVCRAAPTPPRTHPVLGLRTWYFARTLTQATFARPARRKHCGLSISKCATCSRSIRFRWRRSRLHFQCWS